MYHTKESGVTLIEVLIATSIVTVMLVAVGFTITVYVAARADLLTNLKAMYLAEEGYEIVRVLRDNDWTDLEALTIGDVQYLAVSTTTLAFSTIPEVIDGEYQRSFSLDSVYRDTNDDVVDASEPGASVDTEGRIVDVSVAGPAGTSTFTALLTNLHAL